MFIFLFIPYIMYVACLAPCMWFYDLTKYHHKHVNVGSIRLKLLLIPCVGAGTGMFLQFLFGICLNIFPLPFSSVTVGFPGFILTNILLIFFVQKLARNPKTAIPQKMKSDKPNWAMRVFSKSRIVRMLVLRVRFSKHTGPVSNTDWHYSSR